MPRTLGEIKGEGSAARGGNQGAGGGNLYPVKRACRCERPVFHTDREGERLCVMCGHAAEQDARA